MNTEWAIAELDKLIHLTDQVPYSSPNVIGSHSRGSDTEIAGQAQVVEKVLARVIPTWRSQVPTAKYHTWGQLREAATRAKAELVREQEINENLGENAPELSAADPTSGSGVARSLSGSLGTTARRSRERSRSSTPRCRTRSAVAI